MARFPIIVTLGAALIGWVAGETITNDHVLQGFVQEHPWVHYAAAAVGAALVIVLGKWMQARATAQAKNG